MFLKSSHLVSMVFVKKVFLFLSHLICKKGSNFANHTQNHHFFYLTSQNAIQFHPNYRHSFLLTIWCDILFHIKEKIDQLLFFNLKNADNVIALSFV